MWVSGPAPSGYYFMGFQGSGMGLSQSVEIVAGATYTLSFYLRNRVNYAAATFAAYLGSTLITSVSAPSSWTSYTVSFTVPSGTTSPQTFKITNAANIGEDLTVMVDNLSLECTYP